MMKGLLIHPSAKKRQKRLLKAQVEHRQQQSGGYCEDDRTGNAFLRVFPALGAKANADIGAAAITDHHRDCQRHHRQREHHRIGSIAERTEIACIGNENLVHNIIQRLDQQRDHTGDRISSHQNADFFLDQKGISIFHPISSLQNKKNAGCPAFFPQKETTWGRNRIYAATPHVVIL